MQIDVGFVFDPEGWVLPVITIDGEVSDPGPDPHRIARDDREALRMAGIDPDEVERAWGTTT